MKVNYIFFNSGPLCKLVTTHSKIKVNPDTKTKKLHLVFVLKSGRVDRNSDLLFGSSRTFQGSHSDWKNGKAFSSHGKVREF